MPNNDAVFRSAVGIDGTSRANGHLADDPAPRPMEPPRRGAPTGPGPDVDFSKVPDQDDGPETFEELGRREIAERRVRRSPSVQWAANADAPDYAHSLAADAVGVVPPSRFELTPQVLELLIDANAFKPEGHGDTIVFALRGGLLTKGSVFENVASVEIEDTRPDHENFRCTIGYYNRQSGTLNAYLASTVPNARYMRDYYGGGGGTNMLPTGCYIFRKHAHGGGRINPAMRLTDPDNLTNDGVVTVLRTKNDLSYKHDDIWDRGMPYDNVHCAYSNTSFSSRGCLTVQGPPSGGPWLKFQNVLRQVPWDGRMDLMLLTGRDAALAAEILRRGLEKDERILTACLRRLRVGSRGPRVGALQRKLGFTGDSEYFGSLTRARLVEVEREKGVKSDGTYCPADEASFDWQVFSGEAGSGAAAGGSASPQTGTGTGGGASAPGFDIIDPETLTLQSDAPGSQILDGGKRIVVPGEGEWMVGPGLGMVTFKPLETFTGEPHPVRYTASDIYGRTATAEIKVTVKSSNKGPEVADDSALTMSGRAVDIAVLRNDSDPDGTIDPSTLRFAQIPQGAQLAGDRILSLPGQGAFLITDNADIRFEPAPGFVGTAKVVYKVADDKGAYRNGTVTVVVNPHSEPPEFVGDTADTVAGQPVTVDVFKNDTFGKVDSIPAGGGDSSPATGGAETGGGTGSESTGTGSTGTVDGGTGIPSGGTGTPVSVAVPLREEDLRKFATNPSAEKYCRALAEHGDRILAEYGINAHPLRLAHFMAQIGHESGGFTIDRESLNYTTARRLMQVWPTRFSSVAETTPYLRNPEKLANKVYGGRMGNTRPGDGFLYRGRGLIQITGRDAYQEYGRKIGVDLENNPDLAIDPVTAIRIAACFWQDRRLNQHADENNIERITYRINGGHNGLASRREWFLGKSWPIWGSGGAPRPRVKPVGLQLGDQGSEVAKLQEKLIAAGYLSGSIDAKFGPNTERSVLRFQVESGLNADGVVTDAMWTALKEAIASGSRRRVRTGRRAAPGDRGGRRAPAKRPATRAPGGVDIYDGIELASVLVGVAALAYFVLSYPSPQTASWPALLIAVLAAVAFAVATYLERQRDMRQASGGAALEAPAADSGQEARRSLPIESDDAGDDAGHDEESFAETDSALRRLGFDARHFETVEPVRFAPGLPEDLPAEESSGPGEEMLMQPEGPSTHARAGATTSVQPFLIASPNAECALIMMFGGDNDLTAQVDRDLAEMAAGNGSGGIVSVLALADLENAPASIVEITPSGERRTIEQLGEIDTGDPDTLATFLARALVSYSNVTKKAIGFWDHGTGVFDEADDAEVLLKRGLDRRSARQRPSRKLFMRAERRAALESKQRTRAMLHDSTGGVLTNLEAGLMLKAAFGRAKVVPPVDLMFSDTCLNGMIEVLEELGPYARCLVASADTEPGMGWDYSAWISRTRTSPPRGDYEQWARQAVDAFGESYRGQTRHYPCTLAAFRSDNEITERFAELVQLLRQGGNGSSPGLGLQEWSLMTVARQRTQDYDNRDSCDIQDFAAQLANLARQQGMTELMTRARNLERAVANARISSVALGDMVAASQGLAFWFPSGKNSFAMDIDTYRRLQFSKLTGWADYLSEVYGEGAPLS